MLDSSRFVFSPTVTMIANNVIDFKALEQGADAMGLLDLIEDEKTPLGGIAAQVLDESTGMGDLLSEYAGRFCYRSFGKGRETPEYLKNILEMQHGSVLEHGVTTLQIIGTSRSLTHELVRHRAGTAYSQESQRYVEASDMNFVVPPLQAWLLEKSFEEQTATINTPLRSPPSFVHFQKQTSDALDAYIEYRQLLTTELGEAGAANVKGETILSKRINEAARSLLPNAAETRLVMTLNMRTVRHVALLRGGEGADLEIRRLACHIIDAVRPYAGFLLADIDKVMGNYGVDQLKGEYGAV